MTSTTMTTTTTTDMELFFEVFVSPQPPIDIRVPFANVTLILYHAKCTDGYVAACILARRCFQESYKFPATMGLFGDAADHPDAEFAGEHILVVDVIPSDIHRIIALAANIHVLDHHKSNEGKFSDCECCTFNMKDCGTSLAYKLAYPDKKFPMFIVNSWERDTWHWVTKDSKNVMNGYMQFMTIMPDSELFDFTCNLINGNVQALQECLELGIKEFANQKLRIETCVTNATVIPVRIAGRDTLYNIAMFEDGVDGFNYDDRSDLGNFVMNTLSGLDFVVMFKTATDADNTYYLALRSIKGCMDLVKENIGVNAKSSGGHPCAYGMELTEHPREYFKEAEEYFKVGGEYIKVCISK